MRRGSSAVLALANLIAGLQMTTQMTYLSDLLDDRQRYLEARLVAELLVERWQMGS